MNDESAPSADEVRRNWFAPVATGMLVVLLTTILWSVLDRRQASLEAALARSRQQGLTTALRAGMDVQATAVQRLAKRLGTVDEPLRGELFNLDAAAFLADMPGLRALAYADKDRVLRLNLARSAPGVGLGAKLDEAPDRRAVFDAVDADGVVHLSAPVQLLSGQPGELLVAPVVSSGSRVGYVVAVVAFDRFFPSLLAAQEGADSLLIKQGRQTIFARGAVRVPGSAPAVTMSLYGQQWSVTSGASGRIADQRPTWMVLLLGIALAALLTWALSLSGLARARERQAMLMSGRLRDQVHAREAMQAALADAEKDMIAVLESISDGVFMVDPTWRFTYVNPQAARMLQADAGALQDVSCWSVLGGLLDDAGAGGAMHRRWQDAMRDGRPVTLEATNEAEGCWYEMRAYPHARGLTVYMHDISERKRRERELLKRDADSRHALQLGRMGSWELYLRSGYLHWSPETCAIFGVEESPGEKGIEALRRRVHPEDWEALLDDQRRLERGDERVDRRYRMIRPDGEVRVIRALAELVVKEGDPIVAGAVQDITEQERVREALSQAMEATQLVMDSAPDVIIVLDREGRLLRVSAAAERLWGYPVESLVGESIARLVHPDDVAATFGAAADIAAGHPNPNFRNRNLTRDGRVLHMQWSGIWSERAQCIYAIGRDHSELHRVEQLEAAQRQVLTAIASGRSLPDVLEAIVRACEAQQPESLCSVLLLEDGRLRHGAAPHLPRQYMKAIDGAAIGPEAGSCGTAAWRRERVVVSDIATDPLWANYAALALPHGLQACWSTPILARNGSVLGTFAVYYGEIREPGTEELAAIDGLAALASIAIEHEQAFRQLSESEQRFRSLFDHHPDAVFALDAEGRIAQANAAASALLGATPAELRQRLFARFFIEDEHSRIEAALASAAGGEAGRLQVEVQGAQDRFPGYLVTLPIMVEQRAHGLFAVLQDHRELRSAQQATMNQLALLSAVAESVGEGLLAVDASGVPTFLNRTAARLLDLPSYGLPHPEALPPEARSAVAGILDGRDLAGSDDASFSLGDGRVLDVAYVATPLRIGGRLAGAVLAFRDIGDIKEARRSLLDRQRFFELSLEVFCIFDGGSGYFVQVNPAFCRLLGHDEATLLAMPLVELVHPQDRMATEDAVTWQYESGEPLSHFVNRLRRADGSDVWLEWTSRRSPEGQIFAVARDVTAKRQADQALEKAMDDLRIRNRELQDFAYVASHDLQEPLRKIQAFSDRLQSRLAGQLDESSSDYLQRMGDAASRMQTLIDDLLAYSRVGTRPAALVPVDLSAELATVLDDLDARVQEAGARIDTGPLPKLQADPSQMRQLLQNLLANALKFRAPDRPCLVRISARPLGEAGITTERWEISVQDNGIGFDPSYVERIFAPFQRLHPRNVYPGTGIGLAIVRRIVERHGGTVWAEGASGQGARFVVVMPAHAAGPARELPDAPLSNRDLPGASS
ncbi:PAS domain S-box protein [Dyella lutea]|uniref:histidine kinase n=1 Tax=Dyella lutea TaxID=2950441 RepID=A0ABT1FDP3_9GAMM|nr:PAS domain S-box protein [Dyella lutea]MCP1375494.1 PAS domain S-box protein [Dyella lutea]